MGRAVKARHSNQRAVAWIGPINATTSQAWPKGMGHAGPKSQARGTARVMVVFRLFYPPKEKKMAIWLF